MARSALEIAVACALIGLYATACSKRDIVLGARGASPSIVPDSGAGSPGTAGTAGTSGVAGTTGTAGTQPVDAGAVISVPQASPGCGRDPVPADDSIEVEGATARYILDVPAAYDATRAYPLVMVFRRSGVTVEAFRDSLGLPLVAGADAILVHPDTPDAAPSWDAPGDLALVEALLAKLEASLCIDAERVFAIGQGQGALLVNAIGCARDGTLRGLAPLSAVLAPPEACGGRAAVWLMQGSNEPASMSYGHDNRDFWIERNGCDVSMPMAVAPSPCVEYAGCDAGLAVRFCEHASGPALPDFTARAIWDFFRAL